MVLLWHRCEEPFKAPLFLRVYMTFFFQTNTVRVVFKNVLALSSFIKIKSNQITFIVTSSQHMCLGEWNS